MTTNISDHPGSVTIDELLQQPLEVGEPDVLDSLAVFPVFGPSPRLDYASFSEGFDRGVAVKEIESGAAVNDLVVVNGSAIPVLLYEGEEVLGAQQNRAFDVTVLVQAGAKLKVPVSCVERGRWDSRRHQENFKPAPQIAYPQLRAQRNRQTRERAAAGLEPRSSQAEVWGEIAAKSDRLGIHSPTDAMHDIYESRRDRLGELAQAMIPRDGQVGALAAIGGRIKVMDLVSRSDVFAHLHRRLVQGYALDAIEKLETGDAKPPSTAEAAGFIALVTGANAAPRVSAGLGTDLLFAEDGVAGSGLAHDGELIQLNAFPE